MPPASKGRQFLAGDLSRSQRLLETQSLLVLLARAVLLSPNYLTTLFRTEVGMPLGSYIKRDCVARAKALLTDTDKSVKEIAYDLGFDDPYTFSRTFKRVEGVAPAHYRRNAKT